MVIISEYYQNIIYKKIFSDNNLERVIFWTVFFFISKKRENKIQLYQNMSVSHLFIDRF